MTTSQTKDDLTASLMGLHVQGVGRGTKRAGELRGRKVRSLNAYAIVYLDGGSGIFTSSATKRLEIQQGALFFLFPGIWHKYGPRRQESWKEYWFIFDGFIPDRFRRTSLLDPTRPIYDMGHDTDLIRRWKDCIYIAETQHPGHGRLLSEKLFSILGHVLASGKIVQEAEDRHATLVARTIALMEEQIGDPGFSLEEHAADLGMCYSGLRRLFKQRVGYSPAQYFSRMKVQTARSRLLATEDPVKCIAADLGFRDPYHFSRRFRQLTGLSPRDYRLAFQP